MGETTDLRFTTCAPSFPSIPQYNNNNNIHHSFFRCDFSRSSPSPRHCLEAKASSSDGYLFRNDNDDDDRNPLFGPYPWQHLPSHNDSVVAEKASECGLQEKLSMIVAVPYLWGIPPASDTLHLDVRSGGGIVQKMFW